MVHEILASFPGLPRFFCSSVSVDNNIRIRKGGEKFSPPFRIRVLLSTETEEQKKRSWPGNEAIRFVRKSYILVPVFSLPVEVLL